MKRAQGPDDRMEHSPARAPAVLSRQQPAISHPSGDRPTPLGLEGAGSLSTSTFFRLGEPLFPPVLFAETFVYPAHFARSTIRPQCSSTWGDPGISEKRRPISLPRKVKRIFVVHCGGTPFLFWITPTPSPFSGIVGQQGLFAMTFKYGGHMSLHTKRSKARGSFPNIRKKRSRGFTFRSEPHQRRRRIPTSS